MTTYLKADLLDAYRFFREHAGGIVGESARIAYDLARAELRMRSGDANLAFYAEDEDEPWDGECEAPNYCFACYVVEGVEEDLVWYAFRGTVRTFAPSESPFTYKRRRHARASLGMVGVNRVDDPYLRVVAAELAVEAYSDIDAEREHVACIAAAEMNERPTFAAGGVL